MSRVQITEAVLDQLREVRDLAEVEDLHNRFTVGAVARQHDLMALAAFVAEADAVRYYRALEEIDELEA